MFGSGPNPEARNPKSKATAWLSALETYTSQTVAKETIPGTNLQPENTTLV